MSRVWLIKRLLAFLLLMPTAGLAQADAGMHVVFVTHGQPSDPYWTIIQNGMNDAAEKLGATVEYHAPPGFDIAQMNDLINEAIASRPDGLVVSIPDEKALEPAVKAATTAGIPVIIIDSGSPSLAKKLGALFFMGQSEFGAGIEAGHRARELNIKHAVCIDHEVGNVSLEARCHGFSSGLGANVPVLETTLRAGAVQRDLADYLTANPQTDFVLGLGTVVAESAIDVVQNLPADRRPQIAAFDISPKVLAAIADGRMTWTIDAQPYLMGYVPVVMFDLLKRYKLQPVVPDGLYATGPSFVEKADAIALQALMPGVR
ncbi:sugar ABC transporter substrate-binding protein [Dongia rigui]|uniref:Sugar ABC transporter substrate-binding protein n=1 Tax=Dongia rigui TaxID=940149 RepID=A0ABU5E447_9PROT|nr:sugar ABC transporter substrate-binding protein [Dongia rigui]MDY0874360.1 sugar ABC transporter substrate-binding protein [Dongia rigui]